MSNTMVGVVSDRLWPLVPLIVGDERVWALIDTGFEGYLLVPSESHRRLGIARTSRFSPAVNADGTESLLQMGRAALTWLGHRITIEAHISNSTLVDGATQFGEPIACVVGLYLLQGLRLTAEFYPGREVRLEPAT